MNADLSEAFGSELVLLGAADAEALAAAADALVAFLDQAPSALLRDIAFTCSVHYRAEHGAVLALVVSSVSELRARLVSAAGRIRGGSERVRDKLGTYYFRTPLIGPNAEGRLAFVFPGAASFYPDMLRDLAVRFREVRLAFDELEAALAGPGPFQPSAFIFPPAPYYRHDADVFTAGGYAEAVVSTYSANEALSRLLSSLGVKPQGAMGFSGGDLNALAQGGLFGGKFDRTRRLNFLRDMHKTVDTAVAHTGLPKCQFFTLVAPRPEEAEKALACFAPDKVFRAFSFSPRQMTVAVMPEAADTVQQAMTAVGVRGMRLTVDRPFNTPWCEKILPLFRKLASRWVVDSPEVEVYSCGTAEPLPHRARKARDEAAEQWVKPVRFADTVRRMHADGFRVFLEVGPRGVMTSVIDDVLRGEEHSAIAIDSTHRAGLLQLQHAIGQLAALGAEVNPAPLFAHRHARELDFSSPFSVEVRVESELRLSFDFPRLTLPAGESILSPAMAPSAASVPGRREKGAVRAAAAAAAARRQRRFAAGMIAPLVSDADIVDDQPGSREIVKTFTFADAPFLADYALGSPQLSFDDPSLHGLTPLALTAGAEIMGELAQTLVPNRTLVAVEDLQCRRRIAFRKGSLRLFVRAERTGSSEPGVLAVRVQLREDAPDSAWTWPAMEGVFLLREGAVPQQAFVPPPLSRPRDVHWGPSDIYPDRLFAGERLRHICAADRWSETGLDYEVVAPAAAGAMSFSDFPVWTLDPQLLAAVTDGFALWRSHERFPGAFSFSFRLSRLEVRSQPKPGQRLHCYLRNTGVTPRSLVTDILVSDGNGQLVMELRGYEELTERVPEEYRKLLLAPASTFLTSELSAGLIGDPATPVSSAAIMDVPYALFERNEELWLKTLSQMVLGKVERGDFENQTGSTNRRTEWLFGRIAAKEAVRRFLQRNYQARWCDADVQIWRDDSGKPHPIGRWKDLLSTPIDLAIAHTAQFVVALVAAHARVGVDVEAVDRHLSTEFIRGVFLPEEEELALSAVDPPVAMVRFWCAKEAVSKALGTGIRYSPRELNVTAFRAETGEMEVSLNGAWLEAFKPLRGRAVRVSSSVVKGHVITSCYIPESVLGA